MTTHGHRDSPRSVWQGWMDIGRTTRSRTGVQHPVRASSSPTGSGSPTRAARSPGLHLARTPPRAQPGCPGRGRQPLRPGRPPPARHPAVTTGARRQRGAALCTRRQPTAGRRPPHHCEVCQVRDVVAEFLTARPQDRARTDDRRHLPPLRSHLRTETAWAPSTGAHRVDQVSDFVFASGTFPWVYALAFPGF
jgi:hypothetical protein